MKTFKHQIYVGFLAVSAFGQSMPKDEKTRVAEVLWLVNYDSEAAVLSEPFAIVSEPGVNYEALKVAWLMQVNDTGASAKTLANAAYFFAALEPSKAVELLGRARALEPCNPLWTDKLAELYGAQIDSHGLEAERLIAELLATGDQELRAAVALELKQRVAVAEYIGILAPR